MVVAGLTVSEIGMFAVAGLAAPVAYSVMLALLGGVLLVGAIVFWAVKRWQQRTREDTSSPADQLTQFRELFDEGDLSAEEFARIRGKLTGRMIQKIDKVRAPDPPPEPPPPLNPSN